MAVMRKALCEFGIDATIGDDIKSFGAMKTLLKVGLVVVGLLFLALLIVPFLIPKRYYIDWAISAIEGRLPIQLSLVDADLRLLPTPHMRLSQVDVKMKQSDGSFADLLEAESIDMATALNFDIRRLGSLENLERLAIEKASLIYPPGKEDAKPINVEKLIIDNIDLTPHTFYGDIDLNGVYDKLTLIGELSIAVRHERNQDILQGQATLRSKSLTVLYSKDVQIRKQAFSLQTNFYHTPETSRLRNARLQLGPQSVLLTADRNINAVIIDFQAKPAQVAFLKTIIPALAVVPEMSGTNAAGKLTIPAIKGKPVDVDGSVTAEGLQLGVYSFTDVSTDIRYGARKLQFSHVEAKLLDGTVSGDADLIFVKPQTTYNANMIARGIAVERIGDVGESLSGRAYLKVQADGKGFDRAALENNLNGSGDFEIKQLKLKKLKFFRPLMSLKQWTGLSLVTGLIDKVAFNKAKNLDEAAQNLTAQFTIGGGAIDFSQIRVNYPEAHVALQGRIGFDESLDFKGALNLSGGLASSIFAAPNAQKAASSEQGLTTIPLKVKGTLESPDIGIDENFLSGKLAGIAAMPVRILRNVLTLPLRLFTPRSHQKVSADETQSAEEGSLEQESTPEEAAEPKKSRSIGPAAGGRRQR